MRFAAMGAVSKIITIGTYVVFGFMKGFQPFAGYNYGAGQYQRLKDAIRLCCLWSAGIFVPWGGCTCAVFSKQVISLFGTDKGMILFGSKSSARECGNLCHIWISDGICFSVPGGRKKHDRKYPEPGTAGPVFHSADPDSSAGIPA